MKLAVLAVFATGCLFADAQPLPLAEMPDLRVEIDGTPDRLRVSLHASDAVEPDVCWRLEGGFEARAAGQALAIVEPGSYDGEDCFEPILELAGPVPAADATLEIGDGSKTISAPLGNMLARRVAELPQGPLSSGQIVFARIAPGDDLDRHVGFVSFVPAAGEAQQLSAHLDGERLTFTMPTSDEPEQGQLEVQLIEWPRTIECGAAVCQRTQRTSWRQPVAFSP